jgi:hypothetical protein
MPRRISSSRSALSVAHSQHQQLNAQLIENSTRRELAPCWFHQRPWKIICAIAVAVLQREATSDQHVLHAWAHDNGYSHDVVALAFELLGTDAPLKWSPGESDLGKRPASRLRDEGPKSRVDRRRRTPRPLTDRISCRLPIGMGKGPRFAVRPVT